MEYSLSPLRFDAGLFTPYFDSSTLVHGQDVYGKNKIDCYNSIGELRGVSSWNRSVINRTVTDNDGNLFVGGSYMETLSINETDTHEYQQQLQHQRVSLVH
jgi:hypothetical protein